ncbi:DNA polymerase IV [Phytoactinopolyspora limicola]|uniref:DNA polymerase IV n=1 Tax=Phytoactinopolyspora limicola TaxID=2715536 RepID=UPI0014089165|nr:DNA polymerase IV [Phytoactinopolyspora limicola]
MRWVLHVDLDQFLAAVEILRRPELRGRPVVVGGDGDPTKRGVVSTASYEAREYGVHSGIPLRLAARRCPEAVFLPVDRETYEAVSAEVMTVLREFGVVEVLGWDEAFVELTNDDAPESTARRIQHRVRARTQLDCSVGIGQNRLHAKLATGYGKPAGVFRLTYQTWFDVLGDQPTDAVWGIGRKTATKLAALGITTVRELAAADPGELAATFGPRTGPWLVQIGQGRAGSRVSGEPHQARSHGREVTFQEDITDWEEVREQVARLAGRVAEDVADTGRPVVRIVVKVRYAPFFTYTHGVTMPEPGTSAGAIEQAASAALEKFTDRRPVRLLGVRAELARPSSLR